MTDLRAKSFMTRPTPFYTELRRNTQPRAKEEMKYQKFYELNPFHKKREEKNEIDCKFQRHFNRFQISQKNAELMDTQMNLYISHKKIFTSKL